MMDNYLDLVSALENMPPITTHEGHVYVPCEGDIKDARELSGPDLSLNGVVYEMFVMYHRLIAGQAVNLLDAFVQHLGEGDVRGAAAGLSAGLQDVAAIAQDFAKFCEEHPSLEPGGC